MSAVSVYAAVLAPRLTLFLSQLPQSISLDSLSRPSPARLRQTALTEIGLIELVSSADFASLYDVLYVSMFPKRAERERSDLIISRLAADERGERTGLAPYRIIGIRDKQGQVIGAAHFSVLPIQDVPPLNGNTLMSTETGKQSVKQYARLTVPYLQYIYVRPSHRRKDISEVLHTMILAVADADAARFATMSVGDSEVPFTLFETEPVGSSHNHSPNHGHTAHLGHDMQAHERSKVHAASGGVALVLRHTCPDSGLSRLLSAHVQPGLEPSEPPITLLWMFRPSPNRNQQYDVQSIGRNLIAAYYQSLRDEGFPEANIRLAEHMVDRRCENSTFEVMSLGDIQGVNGTDGEIELSTEAVR